MITEINYTNKMSAENFKYKLGLQGKDKITGMTGILVGRCQHLFGCNTYGIAPQTLNEGKRPETEWFDEGRIQIVGEGIAAEEVRAEKPGCDYRDHP